MRAIPPARREATKVLVIEDKKRLVDLARGYPDREELDVLAAHNGRSSLVSLRVRASRT